MPQEFLPRVREDDVLPVRGAKARFVRTVEQAAVFEALEIDAAEDFAWNVAAGEVMMCPADMPPPTSGDKLEVAEHKLMVSELALAQVRALAPKGNYAVLEGRIAVDRAEYRRIQSSTLRALMVRAMRPMASVSGRSVRSTRGRRVASRSAGGGNSGDRPRGEPDPPPLGGFCKTYSFAGGAR